MFSIASHCNSSQRKLLQLHVLQLPELLQLLELPVLQLLQLPVSMIPEICSSFSPLHLLLCTSITTIACRGVFW